MALKIACGQIEIIAGRPDLNTKKILHHMDMACQNGIDILLLPELAVPGYFLGDLWEQTAFIEDCAVPLEHLADYTDAVTALFERLDRASLAAQRRLTVPFLRQVLGAEGADSVVP